MCVHEKLQSFAQGSITHWSASTLAAQGCVCMIGCGKQLVLRIVLVREALSCEFSLCLNHCCDFICDGDAMTKHSRLVDITTEKPSVLITLQTGVMPQGQNIRDTPTGSSQQQQHWNVFRS